jgi:hypothetical protein
MRLFLRRLLWTTTVLLVADPAGSPSLTGAAEPEAATCDRFTLEKVRLGMNRSELEALSLGKIEVLGETTDTLRLRVRSAKQKRKEMHLQLAYGRVHFVEVVQTAGTASAVAALSDLRGRWGEPENDPNPGKDKQGRAVYNLLKWSDRNCPAYGAYYYDAAHLYLVLSSSPNIFNSEADRPAIAK